MLGHGCQVHTPPPHHSLAVRLWAGRLTFLGLCFLFCKMSVILVATSRIAVRIHCKELGPRPGAQWCCVCLMLLLLLLLSGEGLGW